MGRALAINVVGETNVVVAGTTSGARAYPSGERVPRPPMVKRECSVSHVLDHVTPPREDEKVIRLMQGFPGLYLLLELLPCRADWLLPVLTSVKTSC